MSRERKCARCGREYSVFLEQDRDRNTCIACPPVADVRPGVVDATLRQVDEMLAAHRAEMRTLVDGIGALTLRDHFAELALRVLPPSVLTGTSDEIAKAVYDLADAMLRRRGLSSEPRDADARDTERPPAFAPEEGGTFDPVVTTIGKMVGPERAPSPAVSRIGDADEPTSAAERP